MGRGLSCLSRGKKFERLPVGAIQKSARGWVSNRFRDRFQALCWALIKHHHWQTAAFRRPTAKIYSPLIGTECDSFSSIWQRHCGNAVLSVLYWRIYVGPWRNASTAEVTDRTILSIRAESEARLLNPVMVWFDLWEGYANEKLELTMTKVAYARWCIKSWQTWENKKDHSQVSLSLTPRAIHSKLKRIPSSRTPTWANLILHIPFLHVNETPNLTSTLPPFLPSGNRIWAYLRLNFWTTPTTRRSARE